MNSLFSFRKLIPVDRSFTAERHTILRAQLPSAPSALFLNAYYRRLFSAVCGAVSRRAASDAAWPEALSFRCQFPLETEELLSVVCSLYNGSQEVLRDACVWSKRSGLPLRLSELLSDPRRKKNVLSEISSQIAERINSGRYLYRSDAAALARKHFSAERFYLVPGGIVFFFPPCLFSAGLEGFPEFRLSAGIVSSFAV